MEQWEEMCRILEPLVADSIKTPNLSWSHERCIIRLTHAYHKCGKEKEAWDLSEKTQRHYANAGKALSSMDGKIDQRQLNESEVIIAP